MFCIQTDKIKKNIMLPKYDDYITLLHFCNIKLKSIILLQFMFCLTNEVFINQDKQYYNVLVSILKRFCLYLTREEF